MREPFNFTTRAIAGMELNTGETDVWAWDADDGRHTGLGVRLRRGKAGISKTWYVTYRFAGDDRRERLGDLADYSLADARHRVYEMRRNASDGIDPRKKKDEAVAVATKAASCPTFATYAEHYLLLRRPPNPRPLRPSTYRERERYLAAGPHFAPFRKMRLNEIDRQTVAARLHFLTTVGITKPSANVAQSARMSLLDLFDYAKEDGWIDINPVIGTRQPLPPKQQQGRDRVLDRDEITAVWNAVGDDEYGKIVKLALLCGSRREEIGGMRWSEFDAEGNWTLPAARSKNKKPLMLPLPPAAREIIGSIERRVDCDYVFGHRGGGFTSWAAGKRKLDAQLQWPTDKAWHLHDLRHTAVTHMNEMGIEPHIVAAITNHLQTDPVIERLITKSHARYQHAAYAEQKRDALRRWSEHVLKLVGANVVPLSKAA